MKAFFFSILFFFVHFLQAQQNAPSKPQYVIIINDEIVSKEKMNEYAKQGYIKQLTKGVSEEERAKLARKLGDNIGDKEFIVVVSLYTDEEKKQKERNSTVNIASDSKKKDGIIAYETNEVAKDFTVQMLDGTQVQLSALKGKVVLINFWATWCAPCLMEFYDVPAKIIEPFKNNEFVFLPISKGESKEKVAEKMERLKKDGIRFPVALDPAGTISNLYGAESIPKNVLIDKNGFVRYISIGNSEGSLDKLVLEIKKLLDK